MQDYQNKELLEKLYNEHKSAYKIAKMLGVNHKTIYAWLRKLGIKVNDTSQAARKHNCRHNYFSIINTPDKAYWLGFIMADGCVYKGDSKDSYRLQINLSSGDRDMLEMFNSAIESDYIIEDKIVNKHEVSTLKINSTKMCKDLISHGVIERKSLVCNVKHISMQYFNHYLRGYFDGDGCITCTRDGKWSVSIVGGLAMLNVFKGIFDEICISSQIYNQRGDIYALYITKQSEIKKLHDFMYKDAHTFMNRKRAKFNDFLKRHSSDCPACE